jgi:protoporphyrinogen oxidase
MLGLIEELGLREKVVFPRPATVIYRRGRFYPFDSMFSNIPLFMLRYYPQYVLRFGLVGLYLRLTNHWQTLEKHTVDAWMRRWAGEGVYKLLWQPLVIGKFGERHYREVNMAWLWARLKSRTTRLGTFIGGFQAFADTFAENLKARGAKFRLSAPVTLLTPAPQGGLILDTPAGPEHFDQCLVTTSPHQLARLAPALPETYLRGLLDLKHMGAVVLVLSLKHQLSPEGYYWYNLPKAEGFPCLALVEHTNFLSPEYFGGDHIVYVGDYLDTDHAHFTLSQDELLQKMLPALERINPNFSQAWINKTWLFRTHYAQPIPPIHHSQHIPAIQTQLEGLFFASMSQVYPWDRGTNFAVEIGRRAARQMVGTET